jgi:hypothetical protein
MKKYLRYWRGHNDFWFEIINAASQLLYENVVSFYSHCVQLKP